MKYIYKCNKCNRTITIEKSMSEKLERQIDCCYCDYGIMKQDFKNKKLNFDISCTFDSYGEFSPKDYSTSDTKLEQYMENIGGN